MTLQPVLLVCLLLACALLCSGVYFYYSYSKDARMLESLASQLTAGITTTDDKVRVVTSFVYGNHGFTRNTGFYLLESLGATSAQVLETGGDCTDKSRLLAEMLNRIGIRASMAMLYPCLECTPAHTVVLAETGSGTIAADPTYDLMFPKETGGYYDVREMVRDPLILTNRLRVLQAMRGPGDRIRSYDERDYKYGFITTVNWLKYRWLEALSAALEKSGLETRFMRRPAVLENPKLLFCTLSGAGAALFAVLAMVARKLGS